MLLQKIIPNISIVFIIIFLTSNLFSCLGKNDARNLKIKKGHPILWVTPELVNKIKQKKTALKNYKAYVKRSYQKKTSDPKAISKIRSETDKLMSKTHYSTYREIAMYYGVNAYMNNDPLSREYSRQFILSILRKGIKDGSGYGDNEPRGRLFALGVLYDWIYDYLSESTRKKVRKRILDYIEYIDSRWKYYKKPIFTGTHCRIANVFALAALLSIRHDIRKDSDSEQSRYFKKLQTVVDNWRYGYNPVESWMNKGGGHHMGWAYGNTYSSQYPYLLWEHATDEKSWFSDWQRDYIYFTLYAYRSNKIKEQWPFSGDVGKGNRYYDHQRCLNINSIVHIYNNAHAKWFYNQYGNQNKWHWDILYNHSTRSEGIAPNNLPLSRYFPNSAFVIVRDTWNLNNNTLLVFKSSTFSTENHHHKDQNSFTIFYKSPLAIDAGSYSYGSSNYWNFYTRSIAHNTMLIYDPKEVFKHRTGTKKNDGGQYFIGNGHPRNLSQIKKGGDHSLDGIKNYEHHTDYTYTMGDATKAYRSSKLSIFLRSIIYLRNFSYNHPVVVVFDKVISKNAKFKKTYLLHSLQKPSIKNKTAIIKGKSGGILFQETILPKKVSIKNVNQHSWRLEISPTVPAKEDYFLNVLSVTDGIEKYKKAQTKHVSSEKKQLEGVSIIDSDKNKKDRILILFNKGTKAVDDKITTELQDFKKILILGLKTNRKYRTNYIKSNTKIVLSIKETSESRKSFKASNQGTIYLDVSGDEPTYSKKNVQQFNKRKDFQVKQNGKNLSCYLSKPCNVKIDLYNINGKKLMRFFEGTMIQGSHSIPLDIIKTKRNISDGLYFGFIRIDDKLFIKKLSF